jgi:hypothetical protein
MLVNGTEINESHSYRIQNNFPDADNSFWYSFNSYYEELDSNFQHKSKAKVYSGKEIISKAKLIREYKTAKLIEV